MPSNLKLLTLNCQKGYQKTLKKFLSEIIKSNKYDFIIFQEANPELLLFLKKLDSSYSILKVFNKSINNWSHLSILYRNDIRLLNNSLLTFTEYSSKNSYRQEFGFLFGIFKVRNKEIMIGNIHLNSGINFKTRINELEKIIKYLNFYCKENLPIIFGGDFNSFFSFENAINEKLFKPYFVNISSSVKSTFDSGYCEPVNHLNQFSIFLFKFGIHFQLKLDHFYTDKKTAIKFNKVVKLLPYRISDHSPLEIELNIK